MRVAHAMFHHVPYCCSWLHVVKNDTGLEKQLQFRRTACELIKGYFLYYFLIIELGSMKLTVLVLITTLIPFGVWAQTGDIEKKLVELGLKLPPNQKPIANYVKAVRSGNLVFLSGAGPATGDGGFIKGKVGRDLSIEQGYDAAKLAGLSLLSSLKEEIGNLNKVKRIVKVLGMVNCTEDFVEQPKVINGFSDLMVSVFGERGKHARSAVGMYALPMNIAVEIEMIVEIED
jgi:enamine deaminase RidA (YjgF/YER057c/UK114 family)